VTRTMYDGINTDAPKIARIPSAIGLVAGYDDGNYAWSPADWALFPNSVHVHVAVFATTDSGQVLDVERGDATPAQSVDWVLMRRRAGADPSVYCNTSTWPAVRAAFQARAVAEPHYWIAQYDGQAAIPPGAIAKQYYNNDAAGYDLSIVADYWPGVDDPTEADMIDQQSIDAIARLARDLVMNVQLGETDLAGKQTGSTISLGQVAARARAAQADLDAKLAALQAMPTATVQLSQTDLAAAVKTALQDPAIAGVFAHALAVELHNDTPTK
jgi:hypothetical protein